MEDKTGKKIFTWHWLPTPKDYPIKSVLEFIFLVASLFVLLFLYQKVNKVNTIHDELTIACLDDARIYTTHEIVEEDSGFQYKYADVVFNLPYTNVEELLLKSKLSFSAWFHSMPQKPYVVCYGNHSYFRSDLIEKLDKYDSLLISVH